MKRTLIVAAAALAAAMAFSSAPAQARMYSPTLNAVAPASPLVEHVQYRSDRYEHRSDRYERRHHNRWRQQRHRYRHCYNQRIRVHLPGGRIVFRTKRQCGWR
jgi:hypothetical protein